MPRKSRKYSVQISNYGRLRTNHEYRKFWNGTFCGRYGRSRYILKHKGLYYDVLELARQTWGTNYRGQQLVPAEKKLRANLVKFRGKKTVLLEVAKLIGISKSRLSSYLRQGVKIKGELIEYFYPSPEKDPLSYYMPEEKWMFPKFGLCEGRK